MTTTDQPLATTTDMATTTDDVMLTTTDDLLLSTTEPAFTTPDLTQPLALTVRNPSFEGDDLQDAWVVGGAHLVQPEEGLLWKFTEFTMKRYLLYVFSGELILLKWII